MSTLFCPKCGKNADIFSGNVCFNCFIENKKLLECPYLLYARICPSCGSIFRKGRWLSRIDEEKTIIEIVTDSLNLDKDIHDLEISISPEQLDYSRYGVHIDAEGSIKDKQVKGAADTEVRISWETCDTCSRISGGYFEGIVQIRADKRIPSKDELKKCIDIAQDIALRSREKGERLAFISQTMYPDEGADLYVGLIRLGKQICRAIIDVFGGKFQEFPKLVGQKNGVDLYRITFALRLPEFVRGDIISVGDKVIAVQNCGKHISGIDIETGKKFIENYNDLMDVKKLGRKNDAVPAVLVSDEGRTIQILDPETYESITIKKPGFLNADPGSEIMIIRTERGIFAVP